MRYCWTWHVGGWVGGWGGDIPDSFQVVQNHFVVLLWGEAALGGEGGGCGGWVGGWVGEY